MKAPVLILGQGAIGTFLGAALQSSGIPVTHYVRNPQKMRSSIRMKVHDRRRTRPHVSFGSTYAYTNTTRLEDVPSFPFVVLPVSHMQWRNAITALIPFLRADQTLVLSGNIWDDFTWMEQEIPVPFLYAFPNFGGAISGDQLEGWLTRHLTTGPGHMKDQSRFDEWNALLRFCGFDPRQEADIQGWLKVHFACSAGMLAEAARNDGFQPMSRKWKSVRRMHAAIRECVSVAKGLGVDPHLFKEGREAAMPLWWNTLKTYLLFRIPGLARQADAAKNLEEWWSYVKKVHQAAKESQLQTPLLDTYATAWR